MNIERIRVALTMRIFDANTKEPLMDQDVEYGCMVQPEPYALAHPVIMATRIRQMAEMHFLYNFIAGKIVDVAHLKNQKWLYELTKIEVVEPEKS